MEITPEIIASFRTRYPAFTDPEWDDASVTIALCEGDAETGGRGWGAYLDDCHNFKQRGMFLYAAHYLATMHPNGSSSTSGGAKWAQSGKSVGDESVSNNNGSLGNAPVGDSWLASTSFGQQWLRLRRRAGMGARAV
jgi:hypothetical protein